MPRLFVDVGYELSKHQLRQHFTKYGAVSDVYLPKYSMGRNKGYAFVTFSSDHALSSALLDTQPVVNGTKLKVGVNTLVRLFEFAEQFWEPQLPLLRQRCYICSSESVQPFVEQLVSNLFWLDSAGQKGNSTSSRKERASRLTQDTSVRRAKHSCSQRSCRGPCSWHYRSSSSAALRQVGSCGACVLVPHTAGAGLRGHLCEPH